MQNKTKFILLIVGLFLVEVVFAQFEEVPLGMQEPGKCYAKCLVQGEQVDTDVTEKEYPVFIGNENSEVKLKKIRHRFSSPEKKWVKKKSPNPCLPAGTEDCMIWCLEDVFEDDYIDLIVVKRPKKVDAKDIEWKTYTYTEAVYLDSRTEFREVLCGTKVQTEFIIQLQEKLKERGFEIVDSEKQIGISTKVALKAFQKHNNLAIGQLTKETVFALDLSSFWE